METRDTSKFLLAQNMKRLREARELSQMALAEKIGCSTTLIGNIETLKRFPSATNLDRIAKALEVPVFELFMQDSPAVKRAFDTHEVRAKLEQRVLAAIGEAFEGRRFPSEE